MDGGAEIVEETGEGEFQRAGSAARLRFGFEDVDVNAALGESDGGGEAVGPGTDDGGTANGFGRRVHESESVDAKSPPSKTEGVTPCLKFGHRAELGRSSAAPLLGA